MWWTGCARAADPDPGRGRGAVPRAATRAALEDRKTIDRAKAVPMKARDMDEAVAYALLRKTAMDQGKRVADIARQLVMAAGLLGR